MLNKLNNLWKIFAGGGTILAYQAWIDRMSKSKQQIELKREISSVNDSINELTNKIDKCNDIRLKQKLLADNFDYNNIIS